MAEELNVYTKPCACCGSDKHTLRQCQEVRYVEFDAMGKVIRIEKWPQKETDERSN